MLKVFQIRFALKFNWRESFLLNVNKRNWEKKNSELGQKLEDRRATDIVFSIWNTVKPVTNSHPWNPIIVVIVNRYHKNWNWALISKFLVFSGRWLLFGVGCYLVQSWLYLHFEPFLIFHWKSKEIQNKSYSYDCAPAELEDDLCTMLKRFGFFRNFR